jgi:PD-(D/E)XK endonuclease
MGNRTAGIVLAPLLQAGKRPLLPFGDGYPYDIAFDDGGRLMRVQCKTGSLIKGAMLPDINLVPRQRVSVSSG